MKPTDPSEQKLIKAVAKYGWHVMSVSSALDEPEEPPFAYTIGLQQTFGWPELLCYGLERDTMFHLLNNAVDELRSGSDRPSEGMVLTEVAEGFHCRLAAVARRHHAEHLGYAIWYARYRRRNPEKIQCLQLLWPDRVGLFPDEPGCSKAVKEMQPVLSA